METTKRLVNGIGEDGTFTAERTAMMREIQAAFYGNDEIMLLGIWARSDGYGPKGFVPAQGYDWSGIRDSSDDAVSEMYRFVVNRKARK